MPTNIVMPQMGESIFEGTITKWLKKEGDFVKRDEELFEISTDKIDTQIQSSVAGVLQKILMPEGSKVPIHTVVAIIEEGGAGATLFDDCATLLEGAHPYGRRNHRRG